MNRNRKIQSAVGVVALVTLGACGGGGHDGDTSMAPAPADNTIPASALASSSAFTDYVAALAATSDETAPPVILGDITAPSSETDAPK